MSAIEEIKEEDPHEFEGLINYLDVLIDTFPRPITRKELAEKTGVSKAAITKIGDRLLKLCNKNALIFSRKLILQTDETYWRLFFVYFFRQRLTEFISSNYGLQIIKLAKIHSKLSEQVKEYSEYFSEEDTETMIRILLHNLKSLHIVDRFKSKIADPELRVMLLSMNYMQTLGTLMQDFDLPVETNEDLIRILTIRDKVFFFVKYIVVNRLKDTSIMNTLSETEKATYLDVYSGTIDFYLRKLFVVFANVAKRVAKNKSLKFKETYETVGHFFQPEEKPT
jgi:hypothetical protein